MEGEQTVLCQTRRRERRLSKRFPESPPPHSTPLLAHNPVDGLWVGVTAGGLHDLPDYAAGAAEAAPPPFVAFAEAGRRDRTGSRGRRRPGATGCLSPPPGHARRPGTVGAQRYVATVPPPFQAATARGPCGASRRVALDRFAALAMTGCGRRTGRWRRRGAGGGGRRRPTPLPASCGRSR